MASSLLREVTCGRLEKGWNLAGRKRKSIQHPSWAARARSSQDGLLSRWDANDSGSPRRLRGQRGHLILARYLATLRDRSPRTYSLWLTPCQKGKRLQQDWLPIFLLLKLEWSHGRLTPEPKQCHIRLGPIPVKCSQVSMVCTAPAGAFGVKPPHPCLPKTSDG